MSLLTRHLALILALLLSLSAPQFAVARTQMLAGPQAVLCIGGGLTAVKLDAEGKPAGAGHFCPDCALNHVALPGEAPVLVAPGCRAVPLFAPGAEPSLARDPRILPPARAPPI